MKIIATIVCSSCLALTARAAEDVGSPSFLDSLPMQSGPYQPNWASLSAQYQVPEWFRDAKLGIFLHWGICSVPARHGWYGKGMYDQADLPDVFAWHRDHYGPQTTFGYKDLIPLWKAEKWDPDALVKEFKAAGARYIMPVAVHHDNFDNYDSKYQPWNSVNMGPHRDIVGDWRQAALKEGLHFTASTHEHETWDWLCYAYGFDQTGPLAGVPYDAWETKADGKGKWWEGYDPADLYTHHFLPWDDLDVIQHKMAMVEGTGWPWDRNILDDQGKVMGVVKVDPDAQAKFIRNWYLRTKDLIDKYHPEILYFDWGCPFSHLSCKDACYLRLQADYYNSSLKWNHGKMLVGANLKHINDWPVEWMTGSHEEIRSSCVEDFEGGRAGDTPAALPWQHCDSVNNEWFDDFRNPKHEAKSPATIIRMLVDTVARNGNLLLNISLHADGTVATEDQAVLTALKAFMSVNGEAIHGTRPWVVAMDRASDTCFTTKKNILYATVLRWPEGGKLTLRALAEDRSPWIASVSQVTLLGSGQEVKWTRTPDGMRFELPGGKPANFLGLTLKLEGKGTPVIAAAHPVTEVKPPGQQDQMEKSVRQYFNQLAGQPVDGDKLRGMVNDILQNGMARFTDFVAIVQAIAKDPQGYDIITLKSFAHAETTYILKIAAVELSKKGQPIQAGDKVIFSGRCESASIKSATIDFPEIHGYATKLDRAQ